jgi:hypothetical protein
MDARIDGWMGGWIHGWVGWDRIDGWEIMYRWMDRMDEYTEGE